LIEQARDFVTLTVLAAQNDPVPHEPSKYLCKLFEGSVKSVSDSFVCPQLDLQSSCEGIECDPEPHDDPFGDLKRIEVASKQMKEAYEGMSPGYKYVHIFIQFS
jgi:hypothetical protein